MVVIKNMTREELVNYCIDKKLKGVSIEEFRDFFDKNEIDSDTRYWIMGKLGEINKEQKKVHKMNEKALKRKNGIINMLIGVCILIIGIFLILDYANLSIFILLMIIWGIGGLLFGRGLFSYISGSFKN